MKSIIANLHPWTVGTAIALAGVVVARIVGPALSGPAQIATTVGGEFLSLLGLLLICLDIRARVGRDPAD